MNGDTVRLQRKTVRQILNRANLSGSFVVGKYRFSPYMACEHGCAYCDGRAERYYVEGEFDRDIVVRTNAPELLASEVSKLRERGFISLGSGISDVYQPTESDLGLTRTCVEVLAEHSFPVTVMTKSHLALRDIDLFRRLASGPGCMIIVSLTFVDDTMRRQFEPRASSVSDRLSLLSAARSEGCHTGVLAMPLIPGLTDTEEHLDRLYSQLEAVKPDFIMPAGLTLRPGRQKEFFFHTLKDAYPALLPSFASIYRENRLSGMQHPEYQRELTGRLRRAIVSSRIPFLVPHRVYAGRLHRYDALQVLMAHMDEIYTTRGIDTTRLGEARRRYVDWLCEKKRTYNRRPSTSFEDLDGELLLAHSSGELSETIGNEKLMELLSPVILEGKVFDYVELRLENQDAGKEQV